MIQFFFRESLNEVFRSDFGGITFLSVHVLGESSKTHLYISVINDSSESSWCSG